MSDENQGTIEISHGMQVIATPDGTRYRCLCGRDHPIVSDVYERYDAAVDAVDILQEGLKLYAGMDDPQIDAHKVIIADEFGQMSRDALSYVENRLALKMCAMRRVDVRPKAEDFALCCQCKMNHKTMLPLEDGLVICDDCAQAQSDMAPEVE